MRGEGLDPMDPIGEGSRPVGGPVADVSGEMEAHSVVVGQEEVLDAKDRVDGEPQTVHDPANVHRD